MIFQQKSKKITMIALIGLICLTLFLNLFKKSEVPACLNADEAAFGYNTYSILHTLKDEHGNFLPMRLKSFDDFKMPLYSYLSIPAIAVFGMTDVSIRFLNVIVAVLLLLSSYVLFKKISGEDKIALLGSFFVVSSVWTLVITRHAHEVALSALFITLASYFAIHFFERKTLKLLIFTLFFALLGAFSYHIGRIYLIFMVGAVILSTGRESIKSSQGRIMSLVSIGAFFVPFIFDLRYGANRLSNLAFYKNIGFSLRITEYLNEHPIRLIHNKLVEGVIFLTNNYLRQLSPDFLTVAGDVNQRFGFVEMSPITPIVLVCALVGIFALFENKHKYRYFVLGLLLISPLGNALTWQPDSLTRTFFLIVPIAFLASCGFFRLANGTKNMLANFIGDSLSKFVVPLLLLIHLFFLLFAYDIYFFHYFKRPTVQSAWQCGNKQMAKYVKKNYNRFDKFYISTKNGQPYIYLLFYNNFSPDRFQTEAQRSSRDEFGFTQVRSFDKFVFKLPSNKDKSKTAYIGFPDEIDQSQVDSKIQFQGKDIFWVKENK